MALTHHDHVNAQFGSRASDYLCSPVHATGRDLQRLAALLADYPQARLLDVGCGAGHASFVAAGRVKEVVAWDLSGNMLDIVAQSARERGLDNIQTAQGMAEKLSLDDASFDVVISRYSAHHWHDVGMALREIYRVLKPGGTLVIMDVLSPGHPVFDIWLQTIEALRDTSHVRDYSSAEWNAMLASAGFATVVFERDKLVLEFNSWVERMRTPPVMVNAIRAFQEQAAEPVRTYFKLEPDGSFTSDIGWYVAHKEL